MWRVIVGVVSGGALGILLAANWPNPNDEFAGAACGYIGAMLGFIFGIIWEDHHDRV